MAVITAGSMLLIALPSCTEDYRSTVLISYAPALYSLVLRDDYI